MSGPHAQMTSPGWAQTAWLFAIGAAAFYLLAQSAGLYAIVFSDELSFSLHSRSIDLSHSPFPNYLYLQLYGATNACGDGFLNCARLMNVAFLIAAVPFIYLLAATRVRRSYAMAISVMPLLAPTGSYSAYFMPESAYFFMFWVLAWLVIRFGGRSDPFAWAGIGAAVGLASLVKPHALFLLPALVICVLLIEEGKQPGALLRKATSVVLMGVMSLAVKLGLSVMLVGPAGLTLFGRTYSSLAANAVEEANATADFVYFTSVSLLGHLMALCLMLGVPLAISTASLATYAMKRFAAASGEGTPGRSDDIRLIIFSATVLATLVGVTALYTASIIQTGPFESGTRLHVRYYNFALPLFVLITAFFVAGATPSPATRTRLVIAAPVLAVILYVLFAGLDPYSANFVDSPELQAFFVSPAVTIMLCLLAAATLGLWILSPVLGARSYLLVFLPILVIAGNIETAEWQGRARIPDDFSKAGVATRSYLPAGELDTVLVVGSAPAGLKKTLFYIDSPRAMDILIESGSPLDPESVPGHVNWILAIGDHPLAPSKFELVITAGNYVLARIRN